MKHDHQGLLEEKCELEEAENDSRLNAQRWEHQHKTTLEKSQILSDELTCERKSNTILHRQYINALSFYVTKTVLVGPKRFWSDQIVLVTTKMKWSQPK